MAKQIVVCLDGTWNEEDKIATNVKKLHDALERSATRQVGYFPGVGTRLGQKVRGGAFGYGLFEQTKEGYQFIVDRYEPGDLLYVFGFSRGAFSVRSLVGMLTRCGVLRRDQVARADALDVSKLELAILDEDDKLAAPTVVDKVFLMYKRADDAAHQAEVAHFKQQHCHDTHIRMIGVWDTVGSLGLPDQIMHGIFKNLAERLDERRFGFLDTSLSSSVAAAYHAVAIDEHRKTFAPTLWIDPRVNQPDGTVEQVWFVGAHSNVGGGYEDSKLSNIALVWMIDKAKKHGLVVVPGREQMIRQGCDANGKAHDSLAEIIPLIGGLLRKGGVLEGIDREIAAGSWIHTSVNERLVGDIDYAPASLQIVRRDGQRQVDPQRYRIVA